MDLKRFRQSFGYALKGIIFVFTGEQNFRFQIFVALLVLACSFLFGVGPYELIVVLLLIMTVLILELLNTALEKMLDLFKPRLHYQVQAVKNIMAAAVLLASVIAAIIGFIIFIPYIVELLAG